MTRLFVCTIHFNLPAYRHFSFFLLYFVFKEKRSFIQTRQQGTRDRECPKSRPTAWGCAKSNWKCTPCPIDVHRQRGLTQQSATALNSLRAPQLEGHILLNDSTPAYSRTQICHIPAVISASTKRITIPAPVQKWHQHELFTVLVHLLRPLFNICYYPQ